MKPIKSELYEVIFNNLINQYILVLAWLSVMSLACISRHSAIYAALVFNHV